MDDIDLTSHDGGVLLVTLRCVVPRVKPAEAIEELSSFFAQRILEGKALVDPVLMPQGDVSAT